MKIAVLMDDIRSIKTYKDTTFALMLSAQKRGHEVWIFTQTDWIVRDGKPLARLQRVRLMDCAENYFEILESAILDLRIFNVVLQRKDPPFNLNYIYDSYFLDLIVMAGVNVLNPPQALRDLNEKFAITNFPQCIPETIITRSFDEVRAFVKKHQTAVLKPLDGMGGSGIFRLSIDDNNFTAILEAINPRQTVMVQQFLPAVTDGDKRILIIHGEAISHGLARLPKDGEFRANLAAGGRGVVQPLTEREFWLVDQVKPLIKEKKLAIVGLDVIGGFITEFNVTSPTCMREIETATGLDIGAMFWQPLEN